MTFAITPIASKDGNAATIAGGVDFVDTSGTGAGPWIIVKSTIDPAGVNVQFVLANNAAKCDISSINGTTTPTGHGTAATALRVELPTDGTGLVNAAQSGTWTVQQGTPPWSVSQSGTWTVQQGTPPWSVSQSGNWTARIVGNAGGVVDAAGQNAASPANEILVAGQFNTAPTTITSGNVSPLQLDSAGNLKVNLNANNFGTVTVGGTVTANAGTNLNTSALALDTSVNGILVAQASTTSGEKGPLVQGAVTTNAPAYTTAQTDPLSLDTSGLLRVSIKDTPANTNNFNVNIAASAATVTVSGTVTANQGGAPWSANITQFGGTNIATGTGASGAGIPRVTVSNDSTMSVTQGGTWTVNPTTAANWGLGATGAAVPANAMYVAGDAATALPAAATAGNLTGAMVDKFGRQVVLAGTLRDLTGTQTTTLSASTAETTIVTAGAAGVFNDLIMLIVSNTSSATNTRIDFRDTTGGTILFSLQSNGGQNPAGFALAIPIPQTGAATNWTAQCATSVTDIRIYAVFAKNK